MLLRTLFTLIGTAGAVLAGTLFSSLARADGLGGFYEPPAPLAPHCQHNGDIIRDESTTFYLDSAKTEQAPATARRIMYCSRNNNNERMAVTGTVLTPNSPWLGFGPRPIIGYAVGTHGVGDACTPSSQMAAGVEQEGTIIQQLLLAGYGVVVTDYQGLGTPGVHTYVIRKPTGHAVLDSVRAAQRLASAALPADGPVVITGYSQGGGAAAAAAELQSSYAPELKLKGVFVGAPPANLRAVMQQADSGLFTGLLFYGINGLKAAYPQQDWMGMFNEMGTQVITEVVDKCTMDLLSYAFLQTRTLTNDGLSLSDNLNAHFGPVLDEQQLGRVKPSVPVFVTHTLLDDIVAYPQGRQMAVDWCERGATVRFDTMLTAGHILASFDAYGRALPWIRERLEGVPASSNCGWF